VANSTKTRKVQPARDLIGVITATLSGDDRAIAEGITATGPSPILALCRKLIDAGSDPARWLYAYRGDTLALTVRSIGKAARLEVNHRGTGFVARCEGRSSPSIAQNVPAHTRQRARRAA
jgi:hypothetical protein